MWSSVRVAFRINRVVIRFIVILLQFDLSCRNTRQTLGAMFMFTNYVTLKYVTDAWGTDNNGFKLVITAVKDPSKCFYGAN